MNSSRHAKPSIETLVTRTDRKLNAMQGQLDVIQSTLAMNKILARTVRSLEKENQTLRRYLGSVLFERRLKEANPLSSLPSKVT